MKVEDILEKWKHSGQEAPITEVEKVLAHFFPDSYKRPGTGSHTYKVSHPKLVNKPKFNYLGELSIPTVGGKKVKKWYLKAIIEAIEIITEEDIHEQA